jgi:hypothetical protein
LELETKTVSLEFWTAIPVTLPSGIEKDSRGVPVAVSKAWIL